MAKEVGFIYCKVCDHRAVVLESGGQKKGNFYTKCDCGITQGGGIARQEFIKATMVKTVSEYDETVLQKPLITIEEPSKTVIETVSEAENLELTVIDNENNQLETVIEPSETVVETVKNPNGKGFLAMGVGLATALGLIVGYNVGLRRG
jgi:hypothetical protein